MWASFLDRNRFGYFVDGIVCYLLGSKKLTLNIYYNDY